MRSSTVHTRTRVTHTHNAHTDTHLLFSLNVALGLKQVSVLCLLFG